MPRSAAPWRNRTSKVRLEASGQRAYGRDGGTSSSGRSPPSPETTRAHHIRARGAASTAQLKRKERRPLRLCTVCCIGQAETCKMGRPGGWTGAARLGRARRLRRRATLSPGARELRKGGEHALVPQRVEHRLGRGHLSRRLAASWVAYPAAWCRARTPTTKALSRSSGGSSFRPRNGS